MDFFEQLVAELLSRDGNWVRTSVKVELTKPRSASALLHDDDAADVRAHIVASLTEDLRRVRAHRDVVRSAGLHALQVAAEIDG